MEVNEEIRTNGQIVLRIEVNNPEQFVKDILPVLDRHTAPGTTFTFDFVDTTMEGKSRRCEGTLSIHPDGDLTCDECGYSPITGYIGEPCPRRGSTNA